MDTTLEVLTITATALLLLVVSYLAWIGVIAAFTRTRWVRCPRCHHHALTYGVVIHTDGCPHDDALSVRAQLATLPRHLHLPHVPH